MRLATALLVALSLVTSVFSQQAMNEVFHRDQTYRKIKYVIPDDDKGKRLNATLILKLNHMEVRTHQGEPLKKFDYTEISSAGYSFSKHPRWKSGTAVAVAVGVFAIPIFFMKGKKHWYTIQTNEDFAVLRLDKNNYRQVTAALENKIRMHQVLTEAASTTEVVTEQKKEPEVAALPAQVFATFSEPSVPQTESKGVEIQAGISFDEVEKSLGRPDKKATVGDKTLYWYEDMVVEFREGKVVDVDFR